MIGLSPFLTQPQPQPQPQTHELEKRVTELQVHREHDREALTDIKAMLNKIQWWLLIMALGQVAMFLFLVKG